MCKVAKGFSFFFHFYEKNDQIFLVNYIKTSKLLIFKIYGEQLPPSVAVGETPLRRGPFDDYPSQQQKTAARRFNPESAVPASQSDNGLNAHTLNTAVSQQCCLIFFNSSTFMTLNASFLCFLCLCDLYSGMASKLFMEYCYLVACSFIAGVVV